MSNSGIHIKSSKRGTLRKAMHAKEGEKLSVSTMRAKMKNASPAMRKKLNFAINARKWHHEDGGYLAEDILYLPEYGFGSWLKENATGLLKGAGSLVSMIPGVGQVAGPVLSLAGAAVGASQQKKADKVMIASQQAEINARQDAERRTAYENNISIRESNLFSNEPTLYADTFAYGGNLMMQDKGLNIRQLPSKANKHSEGIGGVPVDIKGNPVVTSKSSAVGMIENGEIVYNGFVFSNSDKMKLKKHGNNTYTS